MSVPFLLRYVCQMHYYNLNIINGLESATKGFEPL